MYFVGYKNLDHYYNMSVQINIVKTAIQKSLNKNLPSITPSILSLILNDAVQYLEDNCNCPPDSLSMANEIEYDCPPDSLSLANEIPTQDNCNCPPDSLSLANEIEYDCPPDSLPMANEIPTQEDWSDQRDEVDCLYDQLEGSFDEPSVSDFDEASVSDLDEASVSDQEFDRELKKAGAEWQSYVRTLEPECKSFTPRKQFDFYSTPRTEKMPSIPSMTAAQKEKQDNELLRLLQSD